MIRNPAVADPDWPCTAGVSPGIEPDPRCGQLRPLRRFIVKRIGLIAGLLLVGIAIAMYMRRAPDPGPVEMAFTPRSGASDTDRIADLEKTLAAQVDRSNLLASRLGELETRLGARSNASNADGNNDPRANRGADGRQQFTDANGNFDPAAMRERQRQSQLDRLMQAGFTQERAEWIERRMQELQVQAQEAQYDAQRNGQPFRGSDIESTLRKEMGDAEYEQYLTATGQPTSVQVMDVLASSAAEKSGLKPGDQIVSYAGSRVYGMNDLNSLTRQGTPGESVTVEVQRNGQTVQVQVPRGVLGVQGGGGPGGRGGFGGGGPGGGRRGGGG
jgi:hypothetical protein